jgi:rsbT co-antagonist protein RsbR
MSASSSDSVNVLREEIKELEQRLKAAETQIAHLQQMIDTFPEVMYSIDTSLRFQAGNSSFFRMVQQNREDVIGHSINELFDHENVARWISELEQISPAQPEVEMITHYEYDGVDMTFLARSFMLTNAAGAMTGIASIVRDMTKEHALEQKLYKNEYILQTIIDNAPATVYVKSLDNVMLIANQAYARYLGRDPKSLVGKHLSEFHPPELIAQWEEDTKRLLESGQVQQVHTKLKVNGEERDYVNNEFPLYDEDGKVFAVCGIANDITELRRAEREQAELQEQIILNQQLALRELNTPLIPLDDEVLVMPLIGTLDARRTQEMLENLLTGVSQHGASIVILDITGVPVIDTHVANVLVQATKATRLLGAEVIVTGIKPEVAQMLISVGAQLEDVQISGTLQSSIAHVLQRRQNLN